MFLHNFGMLGKGLRDPYFSSVSLLLHGEGTNGSTTFTDSSRNARTPTVTGNTQISTAQFKFGVSSILFDGTGDYLTYADSTDFEFGSGDGTFECFVRIVANPSAGNAGTIACKIGGSNNEFQLYTKNVAGTVTWNLDVYATGTSRFLASSTAPSTATWYHVAWTKSGQTIRLFVDGVIVASGTITGDMNAGTSTFRLGADNTGGDAFNGYVDEVRVTKGFARYTSAFTPPTAAFPNS